MQGLPSQLWGFNLLLLQLHGEICLSLLWSHSPWLSGLFLALPLHVCHPQVSPLCPGKRGQKQLLIRAHFLTQAWDRDGYSSHSWDMWGAPAKAEAGMKLQQPEACPAFSGESWSHIGGPLAVVGCRGSWERVGNYLHFHTGPLVAAAAVVVPAFVV